MRDTVCVEKQARVIARSRVEENVLERASNFFRDIHTGIDRSRPDRVGSWSEIGKRDRPFVGAVWDLIGRFAVRVFKSDLQESDADVITRSARRSHTGICESRVHCG